MTGVSPGSMTGVSPGSMTGVSPGSMTGVSPGPMTGVSSGSMAGVSPRAVSSTSGVSPRAAIISDNQISSLSSSYTRINDKGETEYFCAVCGDKAGKHSYYGGQVCASCRAFFRRSVQTKYYEVFEQWYEGFLGAFR